MREVTDSELPGRIIAMHCQTIQELTAKLERLRQSNEALLEVAKAADETHNVLNKLAETYPNESMMLRMKRIKLREALKPIQAMLEEEV